MSKARQNRLREARKWFPEQGFTEDSHVVKAYRKKFNVDRVCAMKELCMLHVLSPEKEASYLAHLEAKKEEHTTSFMADLKEGWGTVTGNRGILLLVLMTSGVTLF
ncbi:MAG: hypothetical protein IJJ64_03645, partial [Butyrivibrio sp.]|nr:hypothetical protein [Butyrivibrio sp.]